MSKSHTKYRKEEKPTKKVLFAEWQPNTIYLRNSIIVFNSDAYVVVETYTSSTSPNTDQINGKLTRVSSPIMNGYWQHGPYNTFSASGSYSSHGIIWKGGNYVMSRVYMAPNGSGDYSDGGYPWVAFNYYFGWKYIGT